MGGGNRPRARCKKLDLLVGKFFLANNIQFSVVESGAFIELVEAFRARIRPFESKEAIDRIGLILLDKSINPIRPIAN